MTSPLMKPTLVGRDTLHELDQPLKILAYVSNHWDPLLRPLISSQHSVMPLAQREWWYLVLGGMNGLLLMERNRNYAFSQITHPFYTWQA